MCVTGDEAFLSFGDRGTKLKGRINRLEPRAPSAHISLSMAVLGRGDTSADAQLARMGYKAELPRNLSMMSILGL